MTLPTVETIFEWNAEWARLSQRTRSHCLLRIFVSPVQEKVVVIVSELYSNLGNVGVRQSFHSLVEAIKSAFSSTLSTGAEIQWVAHYGMCSTARSYADQGTPETFLQIELDAETGEEIEARFSEAEFQEQLDWLDLNSVERVLIALGKA
jgi:hypothetical protein